ncbi:PEGA domain-containing protein [Sorangium sp. So ce341]|uniref:PEGA domain-containing protein n=1 Tax=Sorangium sp. So ce341 TaxID=3133302 RepID=UPI003F60D163
MRPSQVVPLLCLPALLASTSPAAAQPKSTAPPTSAAAPKSARRPRIQRAPSDAMSDKARKLYIEGVAASEQNRWADAYASFVAAWALQKHYTIVGGIGTCELMLQRYRDAAEHLALYVRELAKDTTATPEEREAAAAAYAQARAEVGAVVVSANVPGAKVLVDGSPVGTTPLVDPVFVEPGPHTITVQHDGHAPESSAVDVARGGEIQRAFELEKLVVRAPPEPAPAPPPPPDVAERSSAPIVAGASVAAAGVIAGVVFTLVANAKASSARELHATIKGMNVNDGGVNCTNPAGTEQTQQCDRLSELVDGRDLFSNLALWSFVGGGAVAVGTLGYWLASPSTPPEKRHVRVVPLVAPGGGGIVAGGVF